MSSSVAMKGRTPRDDLSCGSNRVKEFEKETPAELASGGEYTQEISAREVRFLCRIDFDAVVKADADLLGIARQTLKSLYSQFARFPPEARVLKMIQLFTLTSSIRRTTPLAWMRQGDVRPAARILGGYAARGRAP